MRPLRSVGVAVLAVVALASTASAQRTTARPSSSRAASSSSTGVWELGADAGLTFDIATDNNAPKTTVFSIPLQSVRAGYFFNDDWSFEPSLGYNYLKIEGFDGISTLELGLAALYHFTPSRQQRQLYVRPFLNILSASAGGNSDTDEQIGAGVGLKWPRLNGRMAWRGEVLLGHVLDAGSTQLGLRGGVSFFTR